MGKEGGCSSDPQNDEGRKQGTHTHKSTLLLISGASLFWFNNSYSVECRHEGCTVCHCFSVIFCALPPATTSGEMGLLQTKSWTTSTKKEKKKPQWTNSTYIWQLSILSINMRAILATAEICVIYGYYVTSSVLHITGSEEMNLKSGWFKQNWTKSMALYLLLICLPLFFCSYRNFFPVC